MKKITIQPAERPDMTLPYPYHIEEGGLVGRQDFWNGKPHKLIGFSKSNQAGSMELSFAEFWEHPEKAVRMYPVFADKKGNWSTYGEMIQDIHIKEVKPKE